MPTLVSSISGVRTKHYEVEKPQSRIIAYEVPGFSGTIEKRLNSRGIVIRETGWTDTDSTTLDALQQHAGDPSQTATVDTIGKGSYPTCYLESCRFFNWSVGESGTAKHVQYERRWKQISSVS